MTASPLLQRLLLETAFAPWDEWYSLTRLALADFCEEQGTAEGDRRGAAVRREMAGCEEREWMRRCSQHPMFQVALQRYLRERPLDFGEGTPSAALDLSRDKLQQISNDVHRQLQQECRQRVLDLFSHVIVPVMDGIAVRAPQLLRTDDLTWAAEDRVKRLRDRHEREAGLLHPNR